MSEGHDAEPDDERDSKDPSLSVADALQEVRSVLSSGGYSQAPESTTPEIYRHLSEREHKQDIELKLSYATWLRRALSAQLLVADGVFVAFAWAGKRWDLGPSEIEIWLGATVVQVVGIVLVVTRHLFPERAAKRADAAAAKKADG